MDSKKISFVAPAGVFRVDRSDGSSLFALVDFSDGSAHVFSGLTRMSDGEASEFFEAFRLSQESLNHKMPHDEIREAIRLERELAEQNEKNIFRRRGT